MPDMNWSQTIGSALILCLSTISVILQPLLSKFSFLINLVSRNSSFSSPLLFDLRFLTDVFAFLLCSWSLPLLQLFFFVCLFFGSLCLPCLNSSSAFAQCLQRWWNGFHQLITCLDHNAVCYSLFNFLICYFLCVTLIPPRFHIYVFCIIYGFLGAKFPQYYQFALVFIFWFDGSAWSECLILEVWELT